MAGRGKYFELLDFPKFAYPSVVGMDATQTSFNLRDRLGGKGFMSYGQIWPRMVPIVSGFATETYIKSQFNAYGDDWKNNSIQDVVRLLRQYFGGRGNWYPFPPKPKKVLGFWFKPSIKGVWYVDGQAYAVLINARKGQRLYPDQLRFLARGVYELHCIDDPADPIPLIIDVSEHDKGEGRLLRPHIIRPEQSISFDEFDDAVRQFLKALELAGVALPPDGIDSVIESSPTQRSSIQARPSEAGLFCMEIWAVIHSKLISTKQTAPPSPAPSSSAARRSSVRPAPG